jgi:hypothetical protein
MMLKETFDIKDLGEASNFLGMEIEQDKDRGLLELHQKYAEDILNRFGM